jgi:cytochrome P450
MVHYDPFSDEIMKQDPSPIYKQLRDEAPAYHLERFDAWVLSRFADIWKASADVKSFSAAQGTTSSHVLTKVQPVTPMINLMDPPEHTQLRSAMRSYFAAPEVAKLEPMIRELVTKCIDEAIAKGRMDVMGDLSSQVAVTVACAINGLPVEDGPMLNELVWRFFKREEGIDGMTPDGLAALDEMGAYFYGQAVKRRSAPSTDDVLGQLTQIEIGGEKLSEEAIASHLSMLIIGGAETFPKTFANIVRRLAEHPAQRAECVADPSLIPDACPEGLRFDMPTQFLCRVVIRPVEFHGETFQEGQPVLFLYPSANHDEREFENPDVFDIHRKPPRILSFGFGPHSCLGINVARLEGKICLEELLKRIPEYELDLEHSERLVTDFVQGFWSLPITFQAG